MKKGRPLQFILQRPPVIFISGEKIASGVF